MSYMAKDELIKRAIDKWCLYGQAINKAYEFNGFLIDSTLLKKCTKQQFRGKNYSIY